MGWMMGLEPTTTGITSQNYNYTYQIDYIHLIARFLSTIKSLLITL